MSLDLAWESRAQNLAVSQRLLSRLGNLSIFLICDNCQPRFQLRATSDLVFPHLICVHCFIDFLGQL